MYFAQVAPKANLCKSLCLNRNQKEIGCQNIAGLRDVIHRAVLYSHLPGKHCAPPIVLLSFWPVFH